MVLCDFDTESHRNANRKRREAPHGEAGPRRHDQRIGRGPEEVCQAEYGPACEPGQGERLQGCVNWQATETQPIKIIAQKATSGGGQN